MNNWKTNFGTKRSATGDIIRKLSIEQQKVTQTSCQLINFVQLS